MKTNSKMSEINNSNILRRLDDVIKSDEDKRLYRALELTNCMKVLLVSDPTTDRSAASMDVNVGMYMYKILPSNYITIIFLCRLFK